jgi:DnaK suppressor protein
MKTSAKAAKKAAPIKKTAPAKKAAPAKKTVPAKKPATTKKVLVTKPVKKPAPAKKPEPAKKPAPVKKVTIEKVKPAPAPAAVVATPPVKPPKVRKGADKNYVAPPTVVTVQTSAKLVHTPTGLGQVLNPAVIPAPIKKNAKLADNWKTKKPHELTDAEVIAMPDEEYMKKTQLAFFKFKLSELRDSILKSASETTEHMRDDSAVVPDPTDRATIEEEHALELRTRDRERKLLKKIQQSLTRIEQEDYGYCDETGEPIGVSRLIARPTASLSLEAQQRRELKQKMFGD